MDISEDFVNAIEDLTDVVKKMRFPAPVVRVDPQMTPPAVHVAGSKITIPPIELARPVGSYKVTVIKRDAEGRIKEMTIKPDK